MDGLRDRGTTCNGPGSSSDIFESATTLSMVAGVRPKTCRSSDRVGCTLSPDGMIAGGGRAVTEPIA